MRLFDTNAISTVITSRARGRVPHLLRRLEEILVADGGLAISFVTQYEIRRGLREGDYAKRARFEQLMSGAAVLGLDERLGGGWDAASSLWARARGLPERVVFGESDLLIAATAIFHELPLVTTDARLAHGLARVDANIAVELLTVE